MPRRDRATEQEDIGRLTVHRNDRRVGGGHHLQLGVHLLTHQLAKAIGLGRIRFDRE